MMGMLRGFRDVSSRDLEVGRLDDRVGPLTEWGSLQVAVAIAWVEVNLGIWEPGTPPEPVIMQIRYFNGILADPGHYDADFVALSRERLVELERVQQIVDDHFSPPNRSDL